TVMLRAPVIAVGCTLRSTLSVELSTNVAGPVGATPKPEIATVAPFMKPVPESVTVLLFDPMPIEEGLALVTTGGGDTVKHPAQSDDPTPSFTVTVLAPVGALMAMVTFTFA